MDALETEQAEETPCSGREDLPEAPSLSSEEALIGRDGWVFLGNKYVFEYDQALGKHVVSHEQIARLAVWLRSMASYAESCGIPFLFAVAPAKWSVYADKLPLDEPKPASIFDRLLTEMGPQPYLLDLRPALIASREIAETYSPLNSHWTDYGAAVAWQSISERLSGLFPGERFMRVDEPPRVTSIDSHNECAQLMGIHGENAWTQPEFSTPFPDYDFITHDFQRMSQLGSRQVDLLELPMQTISPQATSGLRALFIRDSTGTQLSPFLTSAFTQTWQVFHNLVQFRGPAAPGDLGTRLNLVGRLRQHQPDVILMVVTERYLALPVDSGTYWAAQHAFESAAPEGERVWPRDRKKPLLRFDGDTALTKPTLLDLSDLASCPTDHVIHLQLNASAQGAICLGYTHNNAAESAWYWVEPGVNDVYHRLPSQIAHGHFWIARHDDSGPLLLTGMTLRAVS